MACLESAQQDERGHVFVEAAATAPATADSSGRFDHSELRCYSCPLAAGQAVARSGLLPVFRMVEAGGDLRALGVDTLSEGAVEACGYLGRVNADLSLVVAHLERQRAQARAAAQRGR